MDGFCLTFGNITHCARVLAVSKLCDAAAATAPENPAARLMATGDKGPISSSELNSTSFAESLNNHYTFDHIQVQED